VLAAAGWGFCAVRLCCLQIFIDKEAETLLLPISSQLVPFHINTIKNASMRDEQDVHRLQINFLVPDVPSSARALEHLTKPGQMFIRSLSYRAKDQRLLEPGTCKRVACPAVHVVSFGTVR
jgi:nucleosome binding factor SPN SPT16 subunit